MVARVIYLPGVLPDPQTTAAQACAEVGAATQTEFAVQAEFAVQTGRATQTEALIGVEAQTRFDDEPEDEPLSEGEREAFLENVVVRALARKSLSEWEVSNLLKTNGVDESELEGYLNRYRQNRYVDDFELAELLVESLHRRKGYGRSQIKNELSARHVQPEIIAAALESLDDDDELKRAVELAQKRAPSLARLDQQTAERRLTSFLMRKGYPSSIVREAVSSALAPQPRWVRFQ